MVLMTKTRTDRIIVGQDNTHVTTTTTTSLSRQSLTVGCLQTFNQTVRPKPLKKDIPPLALVIKTMHRALVVGPIFLVAASWRIFVRLGRAMPVGVKKQNYYQPKLTATRKPNPSSEYVLLWIGARHVMLPWQRLLEIRHFSIYSDNSLEKDKSRTAFLVTTKTILIWETYTRRWFHRHRCA